MAISGYILILFSALGIALAYRDCFHCSSPGNGYIAARSCKKPDLSKIHRIRVVDEKKDCVACYKQIDGVLNSVARGCLDDDSWKSVKDEYGFKEIDGCKSGGNVTDFCVCERNMCNEVAPHVAGYFVVLLGSAISAFFVAV